jgi:hypothetical protein
MTAFAPLEATSRLPRNAARLSKGSAHGSNFGLRPFMTNNLASATARASAAVG